VSEDRERVREQWRKAMQEGDTAAMREHEAALEAMAPAPLSAAPAIEVRGIARPRVAQGPWRPLGRRRPAPDVAHEAHTGGGQWPPGEPPDACGRPPLPAPDWFRQAVVR